MAMAVDNTDSNLGFRYWCPVRRLFGPDAPFFASGNIERELLAKQPRCTVRLARPLSIAAQAETSRLPEQQSPQDLLEFIGFTIKVALDLSEDEKQQLMGDEENRYYWSNVDVARRVAIGVRIGADQDLVQGVGEENLVGTGWVPLASYGADLIRWSGVSVAVLNFLTRGVYCPIVGCGAKLKSLEEFEDHYNARHTASCSVCSRVFPTSRLLSIHVSEAHDSFFQAKVARGFPMYECLVEGCGTKLKNYKSRHQHLVDKHKFPASFEFLKKARPSKKHRQKSQRKQPHRTEEGSNAMQVEEETMDGLVSAVSKLSTSDSSPSSISFGRRHNRGLTFVPRAVQRERRPGSSTTGMER
ncbi:hypothetical protein RJ640_028139 [Escallonia rubra]|uniref:C2H2-type domain-containing protein n=1 Tax=Escallonia rubra TaxID=112253 RepID=A0AA88UW90_9ASTE|nr:hypothetical protein RJ640_028139 [Escallonia rubra]